MNFIAQTSATNCGPIAIYNALQWQKTSTSWFSCKFPKISKWIQIKFLELVCRCNSKEGTTVESLVNICLKVLSSKRSVRFVQESKLDHISYYLDEGTAAIITYKNFNNPFKKKHDYDGHAAFLYKKGTEYFLINDVIENKRYITLNVDLDFLNKITRDNSNLILVHK